MLERCMYRGGKECLKHGGTGDLHHTAGYKHKYQNKREMGEPLGEPTTSKSLGDHYTLKSLEEFFDEDFASYVLNVGISDVMHSSESIEKSLYDFDVETEEGITKLLELLPIMDPEILQAVAGEIWPGYPIQEDHNLLRLEIRGYLLDRLEEEQGNELA